MTPRPATVHALVVFARERLIRAGLLPDTAWIDAEVLARELLGWDRAAYLADRETVPPAWFEPRYDAWIARREQREPVAQILGRREFWGLDFAVSRHVLTPRPETELVVEEAFARLGACPGPLRAADVGTGSGVLAIALAREWPDAAFVATDISAEALGVAGTNARTHGVAGRVQFVRTNLLEGLAGPFHVIVSNPPYVPDGARAVLSRDVREYEPEVALYGGEDGMAVIAALLAQATRALAPGGYVIHEFGAGQDDRLRAVAEREPGLELLAIREDLQGIPRVAVFRSGRGSGVDAGGDSSRSE